MTPVPSTLPRLAVLLSGSGRTLVNLAKAIGEGRLHAEIVHVVASRPCAGIDRAKELGIPVELIRGEIPPTRLEALVREHRIDWVVLAGYLRLLPIPVSLDGRIVNIHPALLPEFGGAGMYGHHVHEAVLAAGRKESGCTVHLCDSAYDRGAIILQKRCPVLPGDTAETLAARVFEAECEAYPEALELLVTGRVKNTG